MSETRLTESEREALHGLHSTRINPTSQGCPLCYAVRQVVECVLIARLEAVRDAFDPGELECGRVGLPCSAVNPPDRWCRPCRLRAALSGPADEHPADGTGA